MPKRDDIHKIMLIGSGPIIIGQACEFDYSGVQACKSLKEEGYEVVLVNSNPATIMTDPEFADRTYIEPLTAAVLTEIIRKERPDALLPTLGGQTALNLAIELDELGVLKDFNVDAEVVAVQPGPVITRFEIQPAAGIKVSKISNLAKDLARSLAVISVRVVEVIPGKTTVGIEIPNEQREMIRLTEVVGSRMFDDAASPLTLALGKDISGNPVMADLGKMPHLLVAGAQETRSPH